MFGQGAGKSWGRNICQFWPQKNVVCNVGADFDREGGGRKKKTLNRPHEKHLFHQNWVRLFLAFRIAIRQAWENAWADPKKQDIPQTFSPKCLIGGLGWWFRTPRSAPSNKDFDSQTDSKPPTHSTDRPTFIDLRDLVESTHFQNCQKRRLLKLS